MPTEMSVRELYALTKEGTQLEKDQLEYVQLQGWIRTNRAGKNVSFIAELMEKRREKYEAAADIIMRKEKAIITPCEESETGWDSLAQKSIKKSLCQKRIYSVLKKTL